MRIILLLCFVSLVLCYIPAPVKIIDRRIKLNPKLISSSSTVYNDTVYVYGGYFGIGTKNVSNTMYKYELNENTLRLDLSIVDTKNPGPTCAQCRPILLPNTSTMLMLTYDLAARYTDPNYGRFQPYLFDFSTLTWTYLGGTATYKGGDRGNKAFDLRKDHNVVLGNNGIVYITGGTIGVTNTLESSLCARSVISYNINANAFTVLPREAIYCIVGANSLTTPNFGDEIHYIGGVYSENDTISIQNNTYGFIDIDEGRDLNYVPQYVYVTFNYTSGVWSYRDVATDNYPVERLGATGQYNPKTQLYHYFGGQMTSPNGDEYLFNDVWTLDTITGTWLNASYPFNGFSTVVEGRSKGSSALLKDKYFLTFYGRTIDLSFQLSLAEIDIFELPATRPSPNDYPFTLKSIPTRKSKKKVSGFALSKRFQFAVVVGAVIGVLLLWILVVFIGQWAGNIDSASDVLVKVLYDRRIGEPMWTEVARCIVKILSFVIFVLFIIYCYDNIAGTTISSTSEFSTQDNLTYPDVRFCFTNWNASSPTTDNTVIDCSIKGESLVAKRSCNQYLHFLDADLQSPLFDYANDSLQCLLFKSDPALVATNSLSTLMFQIIKDPAYLVDYSLIYVNTYAAVEDPNRYIFFNERLPTDWTQERIQTWAQLGDNSVQSTDDYANININDSLSITFDTKTYNNLDPHGVWNYIGSLFPSYITTENFTKTYNHKAKTPSGTVIELAPVTFDKEIITYQRDNTILGAIATAGGILGLISTMIGLLFGGRPFSAWGLIHLMFRRRHEQLLSETLDAGLFKVQSNADEETAYVPLVTPVESRFTQAFNEISHEKYRYDPTEVVDEMHQRLLRLEARNQMMEIVLKAYYIDDHIFHTLNQQREANPHVGKSLSSYKEYTDTEQMYPTTGETTPINGSVLSK